ncbi:ATP-binding cassette domain-containing protein [Coprobacter sp.]
MKTCVTFNNPIPRLPEIRFKNSLNWTIKSGEQWAIIGPNGAGKTIISDLLQGKFALKEGEIIYNYPGKVSDIVKAIAFKDIHTIADSRTTFYQQRWHSSESEGIPTIKDLLLKNCDKDSIRKLFILFRIEEILNKKVIYLSSGELRKFLIIRTLLTHPHILILDNPFIGLDSASRALLSEMLSQMTKLEGLHVILLLSNPDDIPDMITDVLPVRDHTYDKPVSRESFLQDRKLKKTLFPDLYTQFQLPKSTRCESNHTITFRMEKVNITYGSRAILKGVDWEVKNGEKWALLGENGSGKSTLLSLIYADNPQSYANTLYLFDKKRGSGESIWDIKSRIGYVSPEMHLYYMENVPALKIVGSGFFDSVGLYRKCNPVQESTAIEWMRTFGIESLKDRSFLTLSSGEQRLILLARAFVKDPDLLILDEPLHGLDTSNKHLARKIIEDFCNRPGKTLVYVTHYTEEIPSCVKYQFKLEKIR